MVQFDFDCSIFLFDFSIRSWFFMISIDHNILDLSESQHIPTGGQSMEEMSFVDSINNAENCGFDSGMI